MPDMLEMIRSMGDQLRWAADLEIPDVGSHEEFVFAGMGGSGIAGNYVAALTSDASLRVTAHKDYAPLPGWVDRVKPAVVVVSYSGNTEETLSVAEDARDRGLAVIAVTTGGALRPMAEENGWPVINVPSGIQPRAALGYLVGAGLRIVRHDDEVVGELREAADHADKATAEGSGAWGLASGIADALRGRATIVYGGGHLSGTAAQRWKTQINENAKMPAWWSLLPELDHNEIVSWESLPEMTAANLGIVALSDSSDAVRVASRYQHTRNLTEAAVPWVGEVRSKGESPLARIISLTSIGDLVSWMLAVNAGVDPVPVGTIENLKKLLVEDDK
jgi:glucose/mannose-6-phosphate isomerase